MAGFVLSLCLRGPKMAATAPRVIVRIGKQHRVEHSFLKRAKSEASDCTVSPLSSCGGIIPSFTEKQNGSVRSCCAGSTTT